MGMAMPPFRGVLFAPVLLSLPGEWGCAKPREPWLGTNSKTAAHYEELHESKLQRRGKKN